MLHPIIVPTIPRPQRGCFIETTRSLDEKRVPLQWRVWATTQVHQVDGGTHATIEVYHIVSEGGHSWSRIPHPKNCFRTETKVLPD